MYKWCSKNWFYNQLSSELAMKTQVLHNVWCDVSGEAAGNIWIWSLLGVKGLANVLTPYIESLPRSLRVFRQATKLWGASRFVMRNHSLRPFFFFSTSPAETICNQLLMFAGNCWSNWQYMSLMKWVVASDNTVVVFLKHTAWLKMLKPGGFGAWIGLAALPTVEAEPAGHYQTRMGLNIARHLATCVGCIDEIVSSVPRNMCCVSAVSRSRV